MDDNCFFVLRRARHTPASVNQLFYVDEWEIKDMRKPSWEPPVHVAYTKQEAEHICKLMNATV
jgi:hypothetical protein